MPTYDYACNDCGEVTEKYLQYPCVPPVKIECKCGALAQRIFTAPRVIQSGYKPGDARYGRGASK